MVAGAVTCPPLLLGVFEEYSGLLVHIPASLHLSPQVISSHPGPTSTSGRERNLGVAGSPGTIVDSTMNE